jgi:plasmid segregation protein ParM
VDVVGIDIGFGFTKATNGKDVLLFKSVFGEAVEVQFMDNILDHTEKYEHLHIEFDGNAFFVGELAEYQSNVRFFTMDQDQFVSRFVKILSLAALSHLLPNSVPIRLVTGLPVAYYRQQKDVITKMLRGEHKVTCVGEDNRRQEILIDINQVLVVPQPFGSLLNLLFDSDKKSGNKRFMQEKVGIIDIGFRTSDYTIANRSKYMERGSRTTDCGISHAFATIAKKLQEKTGVNPELYRLYKSVERGSIKIRGKNYDLTKFIEQVFSQLASDVANEVNQLWAEDWDIDTIVITGGGGAVLAPFLKPLLHGQVMDIDSTRDARLNNVHGYWRYGKHLWDKTE